MTEFEHHKFGRMDSPKTAKRREDLEKLLTPIADYLEKEGKGFIFSPTITGESGANALCAISIGHDGFEDGITEFFATLMSIIHAMNYEIPEDKRDLWREGYGTFIEATTALCFPNIKIVKTKL